MIRPLSMLSSRWKSSVAIGRMWPNGKLAMTGPFTFGRKAAEELSKLRFIRAVGELPENHSGTAFEEAVLFEHGQAAVEFVSRFVQVLEDQDSSGRVRRNGVPQSVAATERLPTSGKPEALPLLSSVSEPYSPAGRQLIRAGSEGEGVKLRRIRRRGAFRQLAEHRSGDRRPAPAFSIAQCSAVMSLNPASGSSGRIFMHRQSSSGSRWAEPKPPRTAQQQVDLRVEPEVGQVRCARFGHRPER